MSVNVDYQLTRNPKWLALNDTQRVALITLWCWIDEQGTDGHIPNHVPTSLGIKPSTITKLTAPAYPGRGPWLDETAGGWYAHDWHDVNPPTNQEDRERWFARRRQERRRRTNVTENVTDSSR